MRMNMKNIFLIIVHILFFSLAYSLIHLDINDYSAINATSPLEISSYVEGSNEVVHPDILYFENAWNGWEYWMVYTPFPDSDARYENPSISVSHDGINWELPQGLSNPIITPFPDSYNPDNYYHSDPEIIMSSDNSIMYVLWREHSGWRYETLNYVSSTDGVNWSSTQAVFVVDGNIERILSPAIVKDDISYKLWTVDTKTSPRTIRMRTSDSLTQNWSAGQATNLTLINNNYEIWHLDVVYVDFKYYMLASVGLAGAPRGGNLYLAVSSDGLTWEMANSPILQGQSNSWDELIYRSTLLVSPVGDYLNFKIWYSSDGGTADDNLFWRIAYSEVSHPEITNEETLPVELASFTVSTSSHNRIKIHWSSHSENNLYAYKIYRGLTHSLDDALALANLIPATNSSQTHSYSQEDIALVAGKYYYWLEAIDYGTNSAFFGPIEIVLKADNSFTEVTYSQENLVSLYPNPFNPSTSLSYSLEEDSPVTLNIYNLKGQLIRSYNMGRQTQGKHKIVWDGKNYQEQEQVSAIYIFKLLTKTKSYYFKGILRK